MNSSTIPFEIMELSLAERILLAEELWNSILPEQDKIGITDGQKQELDRRLADYHESPENGASWEDAKNKIKDCELIKLLI